MKNSSLFSRGCLITLLFFASVQNVLAEQTYLSVITGDNAKSVYSVTFDGSPRVSQLVTQGSTLVKQNSQNTLAHTTDVIYWQGAGLFEDFTSGEANTLLQDVTTKLTTLTAHWQENEDKHSAVKSLSDFIASSTFKTRINVELDQDFYLAGGKTNPLMNGNLTLLLPSRSSHVWVVGAVTQSIDADFSPSYVADDYLEQADKLNMFGISDVAVIQPGGVLETHQVAYWNEIPMNIAPGAIMFVPFQGLPSALKSLNRDIPRLLQHRVM